MTDFVVIFVLSLIPVTAIIGVLIWSIYYLNHEDDTNKNKSKRIPITYKQFKQLVDSALTLRNFIELTDDEDMKDLTIKISFFNSKHGLTHVMLYMGTSETTREELFKIKFLHGLPCKIYATKVMKSENSRIFQNMIDRIQDTYNCYASSILNDVDDD